MVDRSQIKEDLPALLTRVTRRQLTSRSDVLISSERANELTSPATIIKKRPLASKNPESGSISTTTTAASVTVVSPKKDVKVLTFLKRDNLVPTKQQYEAYKTGRNPYQCLSCDKSFSRSAINSHVKTKHKGKNTKVSCLFCAKKFDRHSKAIDHVTSGHKVYTCVKENCDEAYSEFERLKGHLKAAHNKAEWPWICGFCDQILFYDLEFQAHIKKHTESAPFACSRCNESFLDTIKLCEHLSEKHLSDNTNELCSNQIKGERDNDSLISTKENNKAAATTTEFKMKDENAVNREIAALLLNLHASRGAPVASKPEDLSLKGYNGNSNNSDSAMDLTKPTLLNTPLPATITKLVKSAAGGVDLSSKSNSSKNQVTVTPVPAASQQPPSLPNFTLPTTPSSYPLYPSLATMASFSPSLAMNSNYLLQNLLLGKMQQMVSGSAGTPSTTAITTGKSSPSTIAATALPTQPLPPGQAMPSGGLNSASMKPPAAVFKTTSLPSSTSGTLNLTSPMTTLTSGVGTDMTTTTVTAAGSNIPLLCGQIVSQLNGLLFLVHGLNNPTMEINLQTQLTAIHTRLQDIVTMVEHTKKSELDLKAVAAAAAAVSSEKILKDNSNKQQKEEEKIVEKHIQDYQRALLKQHEENTRSKGNKAGNNHVDHGDDSSLNDSMEQQEAESTSGYLSAAARRRRGRPPKNSNLDLSYSPPEKQMRMSSSSDKAISGDSGAEVANGGMMMQAAVAAAAAAANGGHSANAVAASSGGGKGNKGIRNRVFCGECGGCLKNDDCGKCRYCKDKTKFGGQNRLRQKCLHRRCQMDTHRRRSSNNTANNANGVSSAAATASNGLGQESGYDNRRSPSPSGIYSGLDLARLAAEQQQQHLAAVAVAAAAAKQPVPEESHETNGDSGKVNQHQQLPDRSGSSASNGSCATSGDEEGDDVRTGKSQSRIDKWKAKHEAMLKLAQKTEDKDSKEEQDDRDKNISPAPTKVAPAEDMLDLDPSAGVCIDFEPAKDSSATSNGSNKPHTRHTAALQQVLSV